MFILSMTPAQHDSTNGTVVSLPFSKLGPDTRIESPSLAQCLTAFNEACGAAALVNPDEVNAHFKDSFNKAGKEPCVVVFGVWIGRDRKPSGFNRRRWQQYVKPTGAAPIAQAAE